MNSATPPLLNYWVDSTGLLSQSQSGAQDSQSIDAIIPHLNYADINAAVATIEQLSIPWDDAIKQLLEIMKNEKAFEKAARSCVAQILKTHIQDVEEENRLQFLFQFIEDSDLLSAGLIPRVSIPNQAVGDFSLHTIDIGSIYVMWFQHGRKNALSELRKNPSFPSLKFESEQAIYLLGLNYRATPRQKQELASLVESKKLNWPALEFVIKYDQADFFNDLLPLLILEKEDKSQINTWIDQSYNKNLFETFHL